MINSLICGLILVALTLTRLDAPGEIALTSPPQPKPNIVFILADDLGWADLGCYGNSFNETPTLDAMARRGVRFTQGYATCPVCSPSRASIMTGKTPVATGVTDWLPGRKVMTGTTPNDRLVAADTKQFLALEETTLAEVLAQQGYQTGLFGKWHLGAEAYFPEKQGFSVAVGKPHGGSPLNYFYPYKNGQGAISDDLTPTGTPGEYLTDRLTDETIKFMEANKTRSFFAYLSHHAVHIPLQPKPELLQKYRQKLNGRPENAPNNPHYAALLESLDQSVGKVLAYLKESGLDKNTIVIFTSDNGGLAVKEGPFTPATSNAPLRAGKGHVYEGGIRVPLIVCGPGVRPHTDESPVWGADFYPTLLEMAAIKLPNPTAIDGKSMVNRLKSGSRGTVGTRALVWHYPHYSNQQSGPSGAIRQGNWKLVQHFDAAAPELYNLKDDLSEQTNLADKYPTKVAALLATLDGWRKKNKAVMPTAR